ncbi:serine protease [Allokutzneria sp. A3M-2-11 16]|uniref:S1 family peptidase n=1 Tax=Allokutzneria sp. A3M-2-11 16 TaxID=2962043 RepID=UPI0020B67D2C|nr:trypsin-like serine protease [Allokutzneria sp. A3M-2-11 16]MCP3798669.1 serine protease [Allokutzneria sp. A3M-2-11 16]
MRTRSLIVGVLAAVTAIGGLTLPAAAAATPQDDVSARIIGGKPASEDYSFMASLQGSSGRHSCGASLIKADWVVTAKHCVGSGAAGMQFRIGTKTHNAGGTVVKAAKVVTHATIDIALVKLASPVQEKTIAVADSAGAEGTATRIIGWGLTCPVRGCGDVPVQLQELDTKIRPDSACTGITGAQEICTDNPGGNSGACYGDSGGPQVKKVGGAWQLIGATSRAGNGNPTCATGPSIYVDVTTFKDWIAQNTGA